MRFHDSPKGLCVGEWEEDETKKIEKNEKKRRKRENNKKIKNTEGLEKQETLFSSFKQRHGFVFPKREERRNTPTGEFPLRQLEGVSASDQNLIVTAG